MARIIRHILRHSRVLSDHADDDYFLMPMTPTLAQRIANKLQCNLPTKKMVDDIYARAAVRLRPQPIPPSNAMITVPVFKQHNDSVWLLRKEQLSAHPLGALVGGHKKDVVVTNKINNPTPTGKVAIYGWHQSLLMLSIVFSGSVRIAFPPTIYSIDTIFGAITDKR